MNNFVHVIEVNGDVCQAVMNLNALRGIHNISSELTEAEAISAIETEINTVPEVEVTTEERLAAAAEFQNIVSLPDTEEVSEMDATIINKNVEFGLWGKAHLDVVAKKGLISTDNVTKLINDKINTDLI